MFLTRKHISEFLGKRIILVFYFHQVVYGITTGFGKVKNETNNI